MSEDTINKLREVVARIHEPHVLIVEDNPDDALLLRHALKDIGAKLTFVDTARDAIRAARENCFCLCLLDLALPDSADPVWLVDAIKNSRPSMPIAVLTGSLHDANLRRVLEAKVVSVLLKPINPEQVKGIFS